MAKICSKCILTDMLPGISFNKEGICNFCQNYYQKRKSKSIKDYSTLKTEFLRLIKRRTKKSQYDCLCLYSGGKDSTNMLYNLVSVLKLRVLAFTLDNWFLSPQTYENIEKVVSKLKVDHMFYKPDWEIASHLFKSGIKNFDKTKESKKMSFLVGHVCWPCFVMISLSSMKIAIEKNILNVVVGTTPGQLTQKRKDLFTKYKGTIDVYQSMIKPFLSIIDENYRKKIDLTFLNKIKAVHLQLLPFYEFFKYNEELAFKVAKEQLGWERPHDTDSCSTNCLINALGIAIHKKYYGINPYLIPLAYDVRAGLVKREDALKAINAQINDRIARQTAQKLDVPYVE